MENLQVEYIKGFNHGYNVALQEQEEEFKSLKVLIKDLRLKLEIKRIKENEMGSM